MRSFYSTLLSATVLLSGSAFAQAPSSEPPRAARPFRTQVQAQLTVSNIAQTVEEQRSQGESARRALYEMVNRECNTLRDVFGGECRLVSLNLTSSVQQRHSGAGVVADQLITNANASYEVSSTGLTKP